MKGGKKMPKKKIDLSGIRERFNTLIKFVQDKFIEKEEQVKIMFSGMGISEHCVVFGPPGNAKSKTINTVLASVSDAKVYKRLVSEDLLPKDLVGQIDLKAYTDKENPEYRHMIKGCLPSAHLASLEEGFNANSFTLNALNMICNEREFNNGASLISVPLISAFIPTNYEPEDAIGAFYDRFLYRLEYGDFRTKQAFNKFIQNDDPKESAFHIPDDYKIKVADLWAIRSAADKIPFDKEVFDCLTNMREKIINKFELYTSPRRWDGCKRAMRMEAFLNGFDEVTLGQVGVLKHILWDRRGPQKEAIVTMIEEMSDPYSAEHKRVSKMFSSMKTVLEKNLEEAPSDEKTAETIKARLIMEALVKIRSLVEDLDKIRSKAPELNTLYEEITQYHDTLKSDALKTSKKKKAKKKTT
jgi:MoxR-like ATPase